MRKSYRETRINPPKLVVKDGAQEVIFDLVSCMCDNMSKVKFKRKESGEFAVSHYNDRCGLAFSNLQMEADYDDMKWAADDADWNQVISMLNTGTSAVCGVRSR